VSWEKLVDKLLEKVTNFFIISLAGFTTLLFFDFLASVFFSFFSSKVEFLDFTRSLLKVIGIDLSQQNVEISPVLILLFYAVIWSYGKIVYILSSILHDRLKGNYISKNEGKKLSTHHETFLKLRDKVIKKLRENELTIVEERELTDYFLYYLVRELLDKEKKDRLKEVTARALEFGFIGLSSILSVLIVGLFYTQELVKEEICLSIGTLIMTLFLAFVVLAVVRYTIRERYISRNFRLYLLFLLKDHLKEDKKEDE